MLAAVIQKPSTNDNQGQVQLLGHCVRAKQQKAKSASGNFPFNQEKER